MDSKWHDADTHEIRNALERLSNSLNKSIFFQDIDNSSYDIYPNILNVLKEENDVISNCRKIKHIFESGGQSSKSPDVGIHNENTFEAITKKTVEKYCADASRNSIEELNNKILVTPSEDTHENNISETGAADDKNNQSTIYHVCELDLSNSQESRDNEDILDLMPSDPDYYYSYSQDLASSMATDNETVNNIAVIQEEGKCENSDYIQPEADINIGNQKISVQGPVKDDFKRYCFSYLKTKTCRNHKCTFIHDFPTAENMHMILKNIYYEPLFDLVNSKSLRRKYGDCFAKAFSKRHLTGELIKITVEFLRFPEEKLTDRIVTTTLNYFKNHDVDLTLYKGLLLKNIGPEKKVYMSIIERVLKRIIRNEDDFDSFKRVCLLLTDFLINSCVEVNASIIEKFMIKLSSLKYDHNLAKALLNLMRRTSAKIFENPAINPLEKAIKSDAVIFEQYLLLKEEKTIKKNTNITQHNDQFISVEKDSFQPTSDESDNQTLSGASSNNNTDGITIQDNHRSRQNWPAQHRICCFYNIIENCDRPDCVYLHRLPEIDEFKSLLIKTDEQKLFALLKHQETIKRYGVCLAQTFYERSLTRHIVMLAVECLKLGEIIPNVKTEVINTTLSYLNSREINMLQCKDLLNYNIENKSVQTLLLEQLLFNEVFVTSTKALNFLIDSISANNEGINYLVAESVLKKVCSSYDQKVAKVFIKIIRLTTPQILKHPLVPRFEKIFSMDKDHLEKYKIVKDDKSSTKDLTNKKINNETNNGNTNASIISENVLQECNSIKATENTSAPSNREHQQSDEIDNITLGDDETIIIDAENINPRQVLGGNNTIRKYYSRDRLCCFYNIIERCTRQNCLYPHRLPELEEFRNLLLQTEQQKLFALIKHQETVKRFGECLAETFYERNSTKQLVMLAAECLKLGDIIPEVKTKVINTTLRYFNSSEINVSHCEDLLNYKVQKKSVQSLLLDELLSNDTFATATKALILLINSISSSNEAFSYCVAENVLGKVCSPYGGIDLARAFIKIIRITSPKILKHPLIPRFEELLTKDKCLHEEYQDLKTTMNDWNVIPNQISNGIASTSNTKKAVVSKKSRRNSNPEICANSTQPPPKPAASISRRRSSHHPLVLQTSDPNDIVQAVKRKKSHIKILPCQWAPLVGSSSNQKKNQQPNG